jgi:hypothetical protein
MAVSASRAEAGASDTPITVTWRSKTFRLVPTSEWKLDAIEAMEEGKMVALLRGILAGDGFKRLSELEPKLSDLREFFEKAQKALGISGN